MLNSIVPAPSPLQKLSSGHSVSLFIKRDDLLHPLVEGSKLRKLAPVLGEAKTRFPGGIVTPGGPFSNHLHALAAAGALCGIPTTGLIRGEHIDLNNPTLRFCSEQGMQLVPMPKRQFDALLLAPEAWVEAHFPDSYFLPQGGNTPEAVESCAEISREIRQALITQGFSRIYCCVPAGTGCTAAGVIRGMQDKAMETLIFPVGAVGVDRNSIDKLLGEAGAGKAYQLETQYIFGGFARFNAEVMAFTRRFYDMNGILLDPLYTAKMAFGMYDLLAKGFFPEGSAVVMLHTGGLQGWQGFRQRYQRQLVEIGMDESSAFMKAVRKTAHPVLEGPDNQGIK